MADGKGCKCAAYSESECGCDADWTPQELIDARAEIARLRMTDAERGAIQEVIDYLQPAGSKHQNAVAFILQQFMARCATAASSAPSHATYASALQNKACPL